MKLEQYFEAYDNTHALAGKSPEWGAMRRRIQWSLARPILELTGRVAFILACLALGWWGSSIGFFLALGTLCFIPQYVGNLRAKLADIKGLTDEEELQKLLTKEARRRMAGAVLAIFWHGGVSLLFLGTSAIVAWLGKDFIPSLVVGLIVGALGLHALFIRLPRASREMGMLERKSDDSKESPDGN